MPDPHHLPSVDPDRTAVRAVSHDPSATIDASADSTRPKFPPPPADAPVISGYRVTGEIARGGMGRVYAAVDLTLDREVAVKTLLPGANPTRFVTESKITARLPHPGIPPVYALGTLADGTPFLAMKLIHGQTLSEQLKVRPSPGHDLPRFVQAFEQIAQAVGFAHSRGVIHRDLKPLNVMVGAFGEVQVMDWGLAREMRSAELGNRSEDGQPADASSSPHSALPTPHLTQAGAVMGTPGYMAPEQARGEPTDARADVFALGSTLATILTGQPAFVGTTAGETVEKAARADLADVLGRLDGCGADAELVGLAKRCLSADRDTRPADGREVAAAVGAYRAGVEARLRQAETERAEAVVREGEQRKRRRQFQRAAGVVGAVLTLGVVGTTVGLVLADQARGREKLRADGEAEAKRGEQAAKERAVATRDKAVLTALNVTTSSLTIGTFASQKEVSPEQKEFLNTAVDVYRALAAETGEDESTRLQVAQAAFRVGSIEHRLGRTEAAAAAFRSARDGYRTLALDGDNAKQDEYLRQAGTCGHNLAVQLKKLGRPDEAAAEYKKALAIQQALADAYPESAECRGELAATHTSFGGFLYLEGKGAEAEVQYDRAIALQEKLVADAPASRVHRHDLAESYHNLALFLEKVGKDGRAEAEYGKAIALQKKLADEFPADPSIRDSLGRSHLNLCGLFHRQSKTGRAEEECRAAVRLFDGLAADYPSAPGYRADLAGAYTNLGLVLNAGGDVAGAEGAYRAGIGILDRLRGDFPSHPEYRFDLARLHVNLSGLLMGGGKLPAAEQECGRAVALLERLTADHPTNPLYRGLWAKALFNLAGVLQRSGKMTEVEKRYRQAIGERERLAKEHPAVHEYREDVASGYNNLGLLLEDTGQTAEARRVHEAALAVRKKLAADYPTQARYRQDLGKSHNNLGGLLADLGDRPAAEEQYRAALVVREQLVKDDPARPEYLQNEAGTRLNLGLLLYEHREWAAAEEQYRRAIALHQKLADGYPTVAEFRSHLATSTNNLGLLFDKTNRPDEAERAFRDSLALRERLAKDHPAVLRYQTDLGGSHQNLGRHFAETGRPDEAVRSLDRSVAVLDPLVKKEPRLATARGYLRNTHLARAEAHTALKQYPEAVADWDRVIELSAPRQQQACRVQRLTILARTDRAGEATAEVDEMTRKTGWVALDWYDFACVYSVASAKIAGQKDEYANRAMELLQMAVDAGWKDAARVRADKDLDPLRGRDDFQKLYANLAKKHPPKREVLPAPRRE